MLDQQIKEQLEGVFAQLERPVTLVHHESTNSAQAELLEMLTDICSASSNVKMKSSGQAQSAPGFFIEGTGVSFTGIPGGHEFTSLIIGILNAGGKGKMPDAGMASRIKALKGPIRIRTYISLSCENCPEVVQALNQMALIHPDFKHEMIDGAYAEEDIQKLKIQGVPSVVVDSQMIHSGRIHFLDLLSKLEEHFGQSGEVKLTNTDLGKFDVVVVGAGPAGISAAIYSVRKGLKTAILGERIGGQVQDTKGIENMISMTYTEGPKLVEDLYKHLQSYPVQVFNQRRVKQITRDKVIHLEGGEFLATKSLIFATGAKWRELGVPGEKEYIGRGVAYCPHCDGPFYKNKNIVVVGGGNSGVEAAIDLAGIAGHVTVLEYNDTLKADQVLIDKLHSMPNTKVITSAKTEQLIGNGDKIVGIEYTNRSSGEKIKQDVDGVFVQIGLLPNSASVKGVLELSPFGEVIIDNKCRTNVPGIYAAGDVTTVPYKQIVIAMGEGAKAALSAFEDQMRAG